ncbi:protein-L-isoaspartate O-methyltransferase family protein [Denitrobaculum tricleocarpae]|uniref:protein-L-isoaspartate O-methyltransferase family protein n=1 Tax=Denitrobaculum tricleocarpae TaxID=2591009 RepID=UPI001C556053|nr:methyltransferase domain-containing protein [Denitrobaculum tricleocarpae]
MAEIDIVRRAYAKQVLAAADVRNQMLEDAFATVAREAFLGPGPWPILRWGRGYVLSPNDDPVYLYSNDLVGIDPLRNLNNGQPALHALLIDRAGPQPGEHAVHIGAGVGYYSAILAGMVGPSGKVTAIEFDPQLAARARENLHAFEQVTLLQGDGAELEFEPADVIYVNAGVTHPVPRWIDRLRDGGRLILPLTTRQGFLGGGVTKPEDGKPIERRGAVFRLRRRGDEFDACWISPVAIFPCEGARDQEAEVALSAALDRGGWEQVTRFYRGKDMPQKNTCWLRTKNWCLC